MKTIFFFLLTMILLTCEYITCPNDTAAWLQTLIWTASKLPQIDDRKSSCIDLIQQLLRSSIFGAFTQSKFKV